MALRGTLIMLSIDGLRADAIDGPTLELPSRRGLIARGARARSLRPIVATVTWPCHTSIVTGVSPARHGELPDDRLIGLGCVDCRGATVDPPGVIAAGVEQTLRHVDRERVWLNPDCGARARLT